MRIVVHDYGGYSFAVQLSRELATRGHHVLHLSCGSVNSPQGLRKRTKADPATLEIRSVSLDEEFEKYRPWVRLRQEREYGRRVSRCAEAFRPDVVLSGNTPLLAQRALQAASRREGIPFIFWLHDLIGVGVRNVLARRHAVIGRAAGLPFIRLEEGILSRSDAVVAISNDFKQHLQRRGFDGDRIEVIENWAPLSELPSRPRLNAWRSKLGLGDARVVLYAGTLGHKHNPDLLLKLADALRVDSGVRVVVVSEGPGADWLAARQRELELENLLVLDYQPYEELPDMLAAADVLTLVLEADAGAFSVPSKLLSYLCAGRAVVAAIPLNNLAACVLERAGAGVVVRPSEVHAFVAEVTRLISDSSAREELGRAGRRYAEATFDIRAIADSFEAIVERVRLGGHAHVLAVRPAPAA